MRREEAAYIAAQAAIMVGVLALVSLPLLSAPAQAGYASNVDSSGVQLSVSTNATQIKVGQSLQVNISLYNTLSEVNVVPTFDDWLLRGVPVALWPPCYLAYPGSDFTVAEAVVVRGYYTIANISSVANVRFGILCMENVDVDHAIFQPSSSQANLTGLYGTLNQTLGPFQLSANFTTNGYWDLLNNSLLPNPPVINNQFPPLSPTATPFVRGVYTVAAADEWGQAVILHFVVTG
jgi:hypothetical protein